MEEQEIYLLITRYLAKQTNTEENERLVDWLAAAAENEQTFQEIETVWQASKKTIATSNSFDRVKEAIAHNANPTINSNFNVRRISRTFMAIAATVLVVFTLAALIYNYQQYSSSAYEQLVTKTGQKKKIILEDGTTIWLAPQSTLKYPKKFNVDERVVELQGQAYFEVSKNPHRPFTVHTSTINVHVLGTHFNVDSYKWHQATTVALLEGKVKITLPGDDAEGYLLMPGQEISVNRNSHLVYQHAIGNNDDAIGWMTNTLVFNNSKLAEMAPGIEQMYGVKLVFADQATADMRLYATFKNESLISLLETIKASGNITYRIQANKVYLTYKK